MGTRIYQQLNKFSYSKVRSEADEDATIDGIICTFKYVFEDKIDIISFDSSFIDFSDDPNNLLIANMYIQQIQKNSSNQIIKPIIGILKIFVKDGASTKEKFRNCWQTFVILPKNYIGYTGIQLSNESEYFYLLDSYTSYSRIFNIFTNELENIKKITDKSFSVFENIKIIPSDCITHITKDCDSGWWAVYNAIMLLAEGTTNFFVRLNNQVSKIELGYKLRGSFDKLNLDLVRGSLPISINPINISKSAELIETKDLPKLPDQTIKNLCFNLETFRDLVTKSDFFIDKTMLIRYVINGRDRIIITRPRRWGKSMNMRMLEEFFQIEVDENGDFSSQKINRNQVLFAGGTIEVTENEFKNLKPLRIAFDPRSYIRKYQGRIPVIFIVFNKIPRNSNSRQSNNSIQKTIRNSISKAYKKHDKIYKRQLIDKIRARKYKLRPEFNLLELQNEKVETLEIFIKENNINAGQDLKKFQKFRSKDTSADLEVSILFLSEFLYNYFKRQCYVIIDEYDAPVNSSIDTEYFDEVSKLMDFIFSNGLKDNKFVEKAILTGIMDIPESALCSNFNNFSTYGTLQPDFYSQYFGFTEAEVNKLIDEKIPVPNDKIKNEIKDWYNGYLIGEYIIYNPWSILKCLKAYQNNPENYIGSYWTSSGSLGIIKTIFHKIKDPNEIIKLFKPEYINYSAPQILNYQNIENNINMFYLLLLQTGYLTLTFGNKLKIPNKELQCYFYETVLPIWIQKAFNQDNLDVNQLLCDVAEKVENIEEYKNAIQAHFLNFLDKNERNEADFQALLGAVLTLASIKKIGAKHEVYCEIQTDYAKRLDNLLLPLKNKSDIVIIHEYKNLNRSYMSTVIKVTEDALWKIYVNEYIFMLLNLKRHPNNDYFKFIICRAIVFYQNRHGKWLLYIKEFKHNIDHAEKLNKVFTSNNNLLENHKLLLENKNSSRKKFLTTYGFNSLYELLDVHSIKNPNSDEQEIDLMYLEEKIPQKKGVTIQDKLPNPNKRKKVFSDKES
jgi:Predicted AAA-ATPase